MQVSHFSNFLMSWCWPCCSCSLQGILGQPCVQSNLQRRAVLHATCWRKHLAANLKPTKMIDHEQPGVHKVLILTELSSNCVGNVVVGQDLRVARNQVAKWLHHFGFSSSQVSIVLHTDSERAVAELVGRSTDRFIFSTRRANPQQHRSVGLGFEAFLG